MKPFEIIADYRENHSSVSEYLLTLPDVQLRWEDLSIGDYIVEKGAISNARLLRISQRP